MRSVIILLCLGGLMEATRSFADGGVTFATGAELAFGFLLLASLFAGRLCAGINVPQLTGYIAAGVVAGPFVLELVSVDMAGSLKMVNGVAVCLIALVAGGELSIKRMKPLLGTIRSMTVWAVLGTGILLTGTIFALQPLLPFFSGLSPVQGVAVSFVLAVVLASQSPAVVMALLSETKSDGPVSQTTLALVVIADLVVILLYALASPIATVTLGGGADPVGTIVTVAWEIFGSAGIGLGIAVVLVQYIERVQRGVTLFVLLVCVVVAEVGVRIHLDPLIVTLVAGVYLENVSKLDATKFIHDLEAGSLPVYLVFFALAGAGLKLDLLAEVIVPAAIIAVVRGVGFWWGCRRAARRTGAVANVEKYVWVGLLPQAGLALALALILQRTFPTFGVEAAALILGVVALNQVVTPIMLRIALVRSGEAGKKDGDDHGHGSDDRGSDDRGLGGDAHELAPGDVDRESDSEAPYGTASAEIVAPVPAAEPVVAVDVDAVASEDEPPVLPGPDREPDA